MVVSLVCDKIKETGMKIIKYNIGLKRKFRSNKKANYWYINIKGFSIITTLIMSIRITEKEYKFSFHVSVIFYVS